MRTVTDARLQASDEVWQKSNIAKEGDNKAQLATRYNMIHRQKRQH